MLFFRKKTPYEKEMAAVLRKERRFLESRENRKESFVNRKLAEVVPAKLQGTLDSAFAKAFGLIFEKGTKVIEKTYSRKNLEIDFYENQYMNAVLENKKTLRAFSKKAKGAGTKNLLLSGTAGVGMGILGIGIPDIPVFTAILLKSVYEIALDYGFDYDSEKERAFILWVIETAVSCGEKTAETNGKIEKFIKTGELPEDYNSEEAIKSAAATLSKELLYMKFVQGIPIIGAVGGFYDAVYMKRINEFANIKYRKRMLLKMKRGAEK